MRLLLILFASICFAAVDDGQTFYNDSGTPITNYPTWYVAQPFEDQYCDWVAPFIGATPITPWQVEVQQRFPASAKCPNGSVKTARLFFLIPSIPATGSTRVTTRASAVPCSGGSTTEAQCWALGLNQSGLLNHNGGAWGTDMKFTAPGATDVVMSARQMITDNNYCVTVSGPLHTEVIAGPLTGVAPNCTPNTARPYTFGFVHKKMLWLSGTIQAGDTSIPVTDTSYIPTPPFNAVISSVWGQEEITINSCNTTSCVVTRGQGGSTASIHYAAPIWIMTGNRNITAQFNYNERHFITLNDVSGLENQGLLWVNGELVRWCNVSGNTLTISHDPFPCSGTNEYAKGRNWAGTSNTAIHLARMPVYLTNDSDAYRNATKDPQKGLQPSVQLNFWQGYAGVAYEWKIENTWSDRAMYHNYNAYVYDGNPATNLVASYVDSETGQMSRGTGIHHHMESYWEFPTGDIVGEQTSKITDTYAWTIRPPHVRRDFNLPQLVARDLVPINPTIPLTTTATDTFLNEVLVLGDGQARPGWNLSNKCKPPGIQWSSYSIQFDGGVIRDIGQGGSRPDLGEIYRDAGIGYLMIQNPGVSGANNAMNAIFGTAKCAGHLDWHNRSADNSNTWFYCDGPDAKCSVAGNKTIRPFGRPLSSDAAHMTHVSGGWLQDDWSQGWLKVTGPTSAGGWGIHQSWGVSHTVQLSHQAYILKRSPFLAQAVASHGSAAQMYGYSAYMTYNPADVYGVRFQTIHDNWGIWGNNSGVRGVWRGMMVAGMAAALLPDKSVEKDYFRGVIRNNIAVQEGHFGITNGNFYVPCSPANSTDSSKWCYGWSAKGNRNPGSTVMIQGPLFTDGPGEPTTNANAGSADQLFMGVYAATMSNYLWRLGIKEIKPFYDKVVSLGVNAVANNTAIRNSGGARYITGYYEIPGYRCPTPPCTFSPNTLALGDGPITYNSWDQRWADVGNGNKAFTYYPYADLLGDRSWVIAAAMTLRATTPEGITTERAYRVLRSDLYVPTGFPSDKSITPHFQWVPQWENRISDVVVTPASTSIAISFTRPEAAAICSYAVNPTDPSDAGDVSSGARFMLHQFNITSLTPATTYYIRLTCKNLAETLYDRIFLRTSTL